MKRRDLVSICFSIGLLTAASAMAQQAVSFLRTPPTDVVVGSGPSAIAVADFDGDGNPDMAVADSDEDDVTILLGDGSGGFVTPGASYTVGVVEVPVAIAVGDFNHDGKPDLITANEFGNSVTVLLNQGAGVFGAPVETPVGGSPASVVVSDFDGDNFPDVATTNNFDDTVSILKGSTSGDGTFTDPQTIQVGGSPQGLAQALLDKDANVDLIVVNNAGGDDSNGTITILKGLGNDVFEPQPEIAVVCGSPNGCGPVAVAVADFDGDHNLDLAVANGDGDSVTTLLGNGDLSFRTGVTVSVASIPDGVVAEDFSGDGVADIATASFIDDKVTVLIGTGDGHFVTPNSQLAQAAAVGAQTLVLANASGFPNSGTVQIGEDRLDYTSTSGNTLNLTAELTNPIAVSTLVTYSGTDIDVGAAPAGLTAADLNGDQKPDLVTPNGDDSTVSVLLNGVGASCIGDCKGGGDVTVDELITMVNIALGNAPIAECLAGDGNNDTEITVDEILTAVNNALNGCPL